MFKVGDKVQRIGRDHKLFKKHRIGSVWTVTNLDSTKLQLNGSWGCIGWFFSPKYYKKVEKPYENTKIENLFI